MKSISFDNTENAFAYKTESQLNKANFLFSAMRQPLLVKWGTKLAPWALNVGLPVGWLIRGTIFPQFVGGETLEETAPVAKRLGEYDVKVILDYGVEGGDEDEHNYDHACEEFIRVINYASTQPNIPFMSIKVTGIARFSLLEKLDSSLDANSGTLMKRFGKALETLSPQENDEWQRVHERMRKICAAAAEKNIGVLVDAEETWIQDPVDVLTMLMMDHFNTKNAVVFNTLQLYRHDRLAFLDDSIEAAEKRNFVLGVKLVRGAYMEKERVRAIEKNYSSPIQPDKSSTDRDFNVAVTHCIEHIEKVSVIVASHNEDSNYLATRLLQEKNHPLNHPHIHFSQLYGMSDHITFNLAKAGCSVSKYLPFGPLKDVVPYLMRRAQENSSVAGQTSRELLLIRKEKERRNSL